MTSNHRRHNIMKSASEQQNTNSLMNIMSERRYINGDRQQTDSNATVLKIIQSLILKSYDKMNW